MSISMQEQFALYSPLFNQLVRESGFKPEIVFVPNARSLQMLLAGEVDAEPFRIQAAIEGIAKEVSLIGPVGCAEVSAFMLKQPGKTQSLKNLVNSNIAVQLGTRVAKDAALKFTNSIHEISMVESRYKMLEIGRVDAVIDSTGLGIETIRALNLEDKIQQVGPVLTSIPTYFVIRRDLKTFGPPIEKTFQSMLKSGKWQQSFNHITVNVRNLPKDLGLHCLPPFVPAANFAK